jgi:outer membrane protein OmpA-like peptidoglycan-associated protein
MVPGKSTQRLTGSRLARATLPACVCAGLSVFVACATPRVSSARLNGLRQAIDEVTRAGAYRCAPRELALARANLEFATVELRQGDPMRAEEHVVLAESNAGAARLLSPNERCGKAASAAPEFPRPGSKDSDQDGVPDATDRCPDSREDWDGYADSDGCADPDNDGDGIPDALDKCPNDPEDRDGFQDQDGCPDRDNDGDGFEDPADDCPDVAGVRENQGCPRKDYGAVTVTEKELRLATPIVFDKATAIIRSVALPALEVVRKVLAEWPRITLEIGGHTDSQGDDDRNLQLSQQQAEAVRHYLVEHGVDGSRLTARGYGETRPIESNSTSQGRAINRRIEFVRTDRKPE